MLSECKTCSCNNFISNRWKKNLCINCYHSHLINESLIENNEETNDALKIYKKVEQVQTVEQVKTVEQVNIKFNCITYIYDFISFYTGYLYLIFFRQKID